MAIRDDLIASMVEAIALLSKKVGDLTAMRPERGPQGERGPEGPAGQDAPPAPEEAIKAAAAAWLEANIAQPADGADGQDGEQGRPPTADEISLAVDIWFEQNSADLTGKDGKDGKNGSDGADGRDGVDGRDGIRGPAGADGVGVAGVEQRKAGEFTVTLTDGREFTLKLPISSSVGSARWQSGGGGLTVFYGAFQDSTSQTPIAAQTITPMSFNQTDFSNGVSMQPNDATKVVISNAGVYNIQWSGQFQNSEVADADVDVWLRINEADVSGSSGRISVPGRHGLTSGHSIIGWNYFLRFDAGDVLQIVWVTEMAGVILEAYPARTDPVALPSTASVVLTVNRVGI
ncbi:MAG: collagen-like protein [Actinobacteria bacterium]|nr:collagen-like protein [Actinomycetota bacterium]